MKGLKQKIRAKSGVSLVEMIFCVLLFTLAFMAGVAGLLYAFRSTEQLQSAADEQKVSDTILNRIEGELAGMVGEGSVYVPSDQSGSYTVIGFTSSGGIPMYISTSDNKLKIMYWETYGASSSSSKPIAQSEWTFDSSMYRGYSIESLTFSTGEHAGRLTVTTNLTLKYDKTGQTFETKRTVCCYNRSDASVDRSSYSASKILNLNPAGSTGT